jgi:hypothetical protein
LSGRREASHLRTLSVAYASAGRIADALRAATEAHGLALESRDEPLATDLERMLAQLRTRARAPRG